MSVFVMLRICLMRHINVQLRLATGETIQ